MIIIHFDSNYQKINYNKIFKKSNKFSTFDKNKKNSGDTNNKNEKRAIYIFISLERNQINLFSQY